MLIITSTANSWTRKSYGRSKVHFLLGTGQYFRSWEDLHKKNSKHGERMQGLGWGYHKAQFTLGRWDQCERSRNSYGSTKTATRILPIQSTVIGQICIGWVSCQLRELILSKNYFKCLEFEHIARNCSSKHDRSNLRRTCIGVDHIAKKRNGNLKCLLCKET